MDNTSKTDTSNKDHNPNHIPVSERNYNIFVSLLLFIYGTVRVIIDDIYIPGKRSPGHHYHGVPAWVLYIAFLFAAANMISVVIDHYDKRNNEHNYKLFARITQFLGWTFLFLALFLEFFVYHTRT